MKTGSRRYGLSSITYLSPLVQRIILKSFAVDESLIKFRSRLSYVQFNSSKRARFGAKFHKLCESSRSYCLNSSIYTGKSEKTPATDGLFCSKTVVLDLIGKRLPDSHTIFMDKCYSSSILFRHLKEAGSNAVGRICLHCKNMPKEFKTFKMVNAKLSLNEALWLWHDKIKSCNVWHHNLGRDSGGAFWGFFSDVRFPFIKCLMCCSVV